MVTVKEDVEKSAQKELEFANHKFGKTFHSNHEGYAVLKEKIEDVEQALEIAKTYLNSLWIGVKNNSVHESNIQYLKMYAEKLAYKAIQLIAMTQKFIDSQKESNNDRDVTKSDYIKNMSDEELAYFLANYFSCELCRLKDTSICKSADLCKNAIFEWLRQPVED